jgi:8-oxo-dGTP diphosphatase
MSEAPALKLVEVVAAVIESEGRILCVKRGPNARAYISGKWEFPGGKVERGEDPSTALVREIEEELRVGVRLLDRLVTVEHLYPDFELKMHAYLCSLVEPDREIILTEHVDFRWADPSGPDFVGLDWAAADTPIVELLRRRAEKA